MNTPNHPIAIEAIKIHGPIAVNRKQTDALQEIQQSPPLEGWASAKPGDKHAGNYIGDVSCDQCKESFILLLNLDFCEFDIFNDAAKEAYSKQYRDALRNALTKDHSDKMEHRNVYALKEL